MDLYLPFLLIGMAGIVIGVLLAAYIAPGRRAKRIMQRSPVSQAYRLNVQPKASTRYGEAFLDERSQ